MKHEYIFAKPSTQANGRVKAKQADTQGFSLVELSIVLVILGLLTGGILAGQNLIRASELRSVSSQYQTHMAAVHTFRDKYFALPGDFKDATKFWGRLVSAGHCVTNSAKAVASPGACDGNGDGVIDNPSSTSQAGEIFGFWQQLAHAGLIEGSYTGISGPTTNPWHSILGENVPRAKISNAGWVVYPHGNLTGVNNAVIWAVDNGNNLIIGGQSSDSIPEVAIFSPEETWNIDTKLDDGKPGTGRMMIRYWDTCTNAVSNGHTNVSHRTSAEYLYSDTSKQCAIYFPRSF